MEDAVVVKVRGKIFVFAGDRIEASVGQAGGVTRPCARDRGRRADRVRPGQGGLGDGSLRAPGVTVDVLRDWVEESYRIVAPKRLVATLDEVS